MDDAAAALLTVHVKILRSQKRYAADRAASFCKASVLIMICATWRELLASQPRFIASVADQ
jgi:hypothetical protein